MWAVSSCMSLLFVASADQLFQDGWTVPLNVAFLIAEEAGWNERPSYNKVPFIRPFFGPFDLKYVWMVSVDWSWDRGGYQ